MQKQSSQRGQATAVRKAVATAVIALLFVITAWYQVLRVNNGLIVRDLQQDGVPMRYIVAEGGQNMPGVLVGHGFSGSRQLMLGYGYALAKAGYAALLWDFSGHGANSSGLNREGATLQDNVDAAYATLLRQPEIDPQRIAILGHSMGSGAAMRAGIKDPERYRAVIAVSPTNAEVTPELPPNLLFLAGAWEPRFVANAERLLAEAGGVKNDFANGRARAFTLIPNVEHITILFSSASYRETLRWLHETLGGGQTPYRDGRLLWYTLHLFGWLGLATAVVPLLPSITPQPAEKRHPRLALLIAPFAASGLLYLVSLVINVRDLGGVIIAGALALWFFILGLIWLLLGFRPTRPTRRNLLLGAGFFALLWLAFGILAHWVWLPWLLIPARLLRWPFWALACLPWLLAAGQAQQGGTARRRFFWWLGQSLLLPAGLMLLIYLLPELAFLALVLPVLPLVLAVMVVAGRNVGDEWTFALGGALFFGWLLLALFPLAA